jgi:ubiquinone/menaquinone biosynthesis C-methylase UbiE
MLVCMDSTLRFSSRAENYLKYRPRYPQEVIETMQKKCGLTPSAEIADIGSGTGALTELFLSNGNRVCAVEPNREMRETAERLLGNYPGFRSVSGKAEATTLNDRSMDYVVVGQAFHWFANEETRREFMRILKPPFWTMIVWNEREFDRTPFLFAYDQMLQRHAPDYARVRHKRVYDTALDNFFGSGGFTEKTFQYIQKMDFSGLKGRMLSSSYTPEPGSPRYDAMAGELAGIFQTHEVNGLVTFEYVTRMYYGTLIG